VSSDRKSSRKPRDGRHLRSNFGSGHRKDFAPEKLYRSPSLRGREASNVDKAVPVSPHLLKEHDPVEPDAARIADES
jgi:hypothetical protein